MTWTWILAIHPVEVPQEFIEPRKLDARQTTGLPQIKR
jgi:hypothetical protein